MSASTKELTDEEIEDYKEAFGNFDKNGDGNIDEGELGVVMRSLGYSPTNQQLKDMMHKVSGRELRCGVRCGVDGSVHVCVRSSRRSTDRAHPDSVRLIPCVFGHR